MSMNAFDSKEDVERKLAAAKERYEAEKNWLPFQILAISAAVGILFGAVFSVLPAFNLVQPGSLGPFQSGVVVFASALFVIILLLIVNSMWDEAKEVSEADLSFYLQYKTLIEQQGDVAIFVGYSRIYVLELDVLVSTVYSPFKNIRDLFEVHNKRVEKRGRLARAKEEERVRASELADALTSDISNGKIPRRGE